MTQSGPWSVKGIDPKAREIAKDLARRSGMTLGEWLNQMIIEGEPAPSSEHVAPGAYAEANPAAAAEALISAHETARISSALDGLAARLEAAEGRSGAAIDHIDRSVRDALTRIEKGDRSRDDLSIRVESAFDQIRAEQSRSAERLTRMEREGANRIEALRGIENALMRFKPAAPETVAELAAAKIADRLQAAEDRTRQAVDRLESSLAGLDQRLAEAEGRTGDASQHTSTVLDAAERRFERLAEELNERVEAARANMAEELRKLSGSDRIEVIEEAINQLASQVDQSERTSAEAIDKMGRDVMRIAETLGNRVTEVETQQAGLADRVGGEMAKMADAMEQRLLRADFAQTEALQKLSGEITKIAERLSERVGRAEARTTEGLDELSREGREHAERAADQVNTISRDLTDRIRQSEERTARLLEESQARIAARLGGPAFEAPAHATVAADVPTPEAAPVELQADVEPNPFLEPEEPILNLASARSAAVDAPAEPPARPAMPRRFAALEARPAVTLHAEPPKPAAPVAQPDDALPTFASLMAERLEEHAHAPHIEPAPAQPATAQPTTAETSSSPFLEDRFDDDAFDAAPAASPTDLFERPFLSDLEEAIDRASGIIEQTYAELPAETLHDDHTHAVTSEATPAAHSAEDLDNPFAALGDPLDDFDFAPPAAIALAGEVPAHTHVPGVEGGFGRKTETARDNPFSEDPFKDDVLPEDAFALAPKDEPLDADAFERELGFGRKSEFDHDPHVPPEPSMDDALRPMSTRDLIAQARLAARGKAEGDAPQIKPKAKSGGGKPGAFSFGFGKRKRKEGGVTTLTLFLATAISMTVTASVIGFIMVNDAAQDGGKPRQQVAKGDTPSAAPNNAAIAASPEPSTNATAPAANVPAAGQLAVATAPNPAAAIAPSSDDPQVIYTNAVRLLDAGDPNAVPMMTRAANLGYAQAQFHLSTLYDKGAANLQRDPVKARMWTERAANSGVPKAMYNLGLFLYAGKGGSADLPQAAEWFRRAAVTGLTDAQYNLGQLYEHGAGTPQNPAQAYQWYLIAAAAGDRDARADADRLRATINPQARKMAEKNAVDFKPEAPAATTALATAR